MIQKILRNKYYRIIYKGCVNKQSLHYIHRQLLEQTINRREVNKSLLAHALKISKLAKTKMDADGSAVVVLLLKMFDISNKIINHYNSVNAEKEKDRILRIFVDDNRAKRKYFYLASSHNDCATDHKNWQGRLYVDESAPSECIEWGRVHELYTMQWVIDAPVWFITRPNCRHYFVCLDFEEVKNNSLDYLKTKYKTHTSMGKAPNNRFQDSDYRLQLLRDMMGIKNNQEIERRIKLCRQN